MPTPPGRQFVPIGWQAMPLKPYHYSLECSSYFRPYYLLRYGTYYTISTLHALRTEAWLQASVGPTVSPAPPASSRRISDQPDRVNVKSSIQIFPVVPSLPTVIV